MAYYGRSYYGTVTYIFAPALYGGYIELFDGLPAGVYSSSVYGGASYSNPVPNIDDALAYDLLKSLSDGVGIPDSLAVMLQKVLSDAVEASDSLAKTFEKILIEASALYSEAEYSKDVYSGTGPAVGDSLTKSTTKPILDGVDTSDALVKAFEKVLSDATLVGDSLVKTFLKSVIDGVEIDDSDLDAIILWILTLVGRSFNLSLKDRRS